VSERGPSPWTVWPDGFTEALIVAAVSASGYPLQTEVGKRLATEFVVQEEWPFLDSQTETPRALDILATRTLFRWPDNKLLALRVRPHLALLVECKTSKAPWVFFKSVSTPDLGSFPLITGLRHAHLEIPALDGSWSLTPTQALGLQFDTFQGAASATASVFSKAVRKGTSAELSGSEAFLSVVAPLSAAIRHYAQLAHPIETAEYFDAQMVIAACVTNAPLALIDATSASSSPQLLPWVRVIRNELNMQAHPFERVQPSVIDFIHVGFLGEYLSRYVLPFARVFARRCRRSALPLATGRGTLDPKARGLFAWNYLRPAPDARDETGPIDREAG
jgi:hypothetical protein